MKAVVGGGQARDRAVAAARARWVLIDRIWRGQQRYREVHGERLAAATTYYGFFAVFTLILASYSLLRFIFQRDPTLADPVLQVVRRYYLPFVNVQEVAASSRATGVVALFGLVYTGIFWVQTVRSSQRLIHNLPQEPGNPLSRLLLDLAVLVGFVILFGISVGISGAVLGQLSGQAGNGTLLQIATWPLGVLVNIVLASALLVGPPRLRIPARRLRWPVLAVGLGITLLNTVGHSVVAYVAQSPAYSVVSGAAALLLYLYLIHRMLYLAAAVIATSDDAAGGRAARPPRPHR
jgi:membrane protein